MKKFNFIIIAGFYLLFANCTAELNSDSSLNEQSGSVKSEEAAIAGLACSPKPKLHYVSTYAGTGAAGSSDGQRLEATFNDVAGVAIDKYGNLIVVDAIGNKIRKINTNGITYTIAGNGNTGGDDGPAMQATFWQPEGVAVDANSNIYVSDLNNKVRKISPSGKVTTFAGSGAYGSADGPAYNASFKYIHDMAFDKEGNLFVTDIQNHKIRKISKNGTVSTYAGTGNPGSNDGPANKACFLEPIGIAVDDAGNVYVSDGNHKIRKITEKGMVSTYAGTGKSGFDDGPAHKASFYFPGSLSFDSYGNLYVTESGNYKVRKITPEGFVVTLAGDGTRGNADGPGYKANFDGPTGIALDRSRNIFVGDGFNNTVRLISPQVLQDDKEILTSIDK